MAFSEEKINLLNDPLIKEDVKTREGTGKTTLSYLASHHVIAEANRIFGFDGWDSEILTLKQVDRTEYQKPPYKAGDPPKDMVSISYLCTLRVTVKDGEQLTVREDTGFGNGVAGSTAYGISSCIELASKEAVTDALKRCMRYYGNKFGLTLYDKDRQEAIPLDDFEAAQIVTEDQLANLRKLYEDRGVDDEWVLTALKAENYDKETLEEMRQDWYQLAFKITKEYKLVEINQANYETDIKKVIEMMKESANINMLKALFKEAWEKTTKNEDKDRQAEAQKIYEELKEKFTK